MNTTSNCRLLATITLLFFVLTGTAPIFAEEKLIDGFRNPPAASKPWCYWYWISDNISKEGITRDLEAMARIGIGEAFIGNIFQEAVPAGDVKVLSDRWWEMVEHAIREADRVGVNIGMFNCPGWSQSGGPWIKPEDAMRYLASSEVKVRGPSHFSQMLPVPQSPFQDVAVLAYPAPKDDGDSLIRHAPKVTCVPAVDNAASLVDEKPETAMAFPAGAGVGGNRFTIDIQTEKPFTVRHLSLTPFISPWAAQCELLVSTSKGFKAIRSFRFDRSNMKKHVGPMPRGPVTISFPAISAKHFRLVFTKVVGAAALAEIELSGASRLESYVEKQLGKMHPTPTPQWDTYLWPAQQKADSPLLAVAPGKSINLTKFLKADGTLTWDVPPGDWIVQRIGMTTTGTRNAPAAPEGEGLEVDKMNRAATKRHFDAFLGEILRRMPANERRALKHVVADSYEMGSQNWTDGFAEKFRTRYGYDPIPWLPVLTGRIVGNANESDRFLWDLRRLVADRIATDYVGGLRDLCHEHGLRLWLENYGHWGFPAEFLQYGGQSDFIGGEFWTHGLGETECRAATSAANIYGKSFVSAEAFTASPSHFNTTPADLKGLGDWCFSQGINHFVLHVFIHQPWEDRKPGVNTWFGTEFNHHNTWFEESKAWIEYIRRCSFLLQQGTRVADVAYFIGEDAPKMAGIRDPALPPGRDYDYINAEVILKSLSVKSGRLVLPHGTNYRVLVLPKMETMRPELLKKISELIEAGATVVGHPPKRSPSMENYPKCDEIVQQLALHIWGEDSKQPSGERRLGKGRIIWGKKLDAVFAELDLRPDFESSVPLRYTHRSTGKQEIYFVANSQKKEVTTVVTFRVNGRSPQLLWPDTGAVERPAVYDQKNGTISLPITLGPHGSVFVVFEDEPVAKHRIVSVTRKTEADANSLISSQSLQLLIDDENNVVGHFWQAGRYSLIENDGKTKTIDINDDLMPRIVDGPWQVTFNDPFGKERKQKLESLCDLSKQPDDNLRYFSGKATYRTSFTGPAYLKDQRYRLRLGNVGGLATVRLNGKVLRTLWMEPWQVDITDAIRTGENMLEVEVAIPWQNRLVGDAKLPAKQRRTFLTQQTIPVGLPLQPTGLMGPVTIQAAKTVRVNLP